MNAQMYDPMTQFGPASQLGVALASANEQMWIEMGSLAEQMFSVDLALECYQAALKQNPRNKRALAQAGHIHRIRQEHGVAAQYFQRFLQLEPTNGEMWGALGHCFLLLNDLQNAYSAYQQALFNLQNPHDPNLWYGIGILYERYGSNEHAEEAFRAVLSMDPKFEKTAEINFRLGIIYKVQKKYDEAIKCFSSVVAAPPAPLCRADVLMKIASAYEAKEDYAMAKETYEKVLVEQPNNLKAKQPLAWIEQLLALREGIPAEEKTAGEERAVSLLKECEAADEKDPVTFYVLGRVRMAQKQHIPAYEAFQRMMAVETSNAVFWCAVGVLYFEIGQYRDALSAFSRAIQIDSKLFEVWYNLGSLYEVCGQINDALDAYTHATKLVPDNAHAVARHEKASKMIADNVKVDGLTEGVCPKIDEAAVKNGTALPLTLEPSVFSVLATATQANNPLTVGGNAELPSNAAEAAKPEPLSMNGTLRPSDDMKEPDAKKPKTA